MYLAVFSGSSRNKYDKNDSCIGGIGVQITPLSCYKIGNDVICTPIPPIVNKKESDT